MDDDEIAARVAARFFSPGEWTPEEWAAFRAACADIAAALERPNPLYERIVERRENRARSMGKRRW